MRRRSFLIGLAAGPLILSGCGEGQSAGTGIGQANLAALPPLPSFVQGLPAQVGAAYRTALAHADALRHIPCYCGCGPTHKSVADCFVRERRSDGTVEWDVHGSACGICQGVALDSARMLDQGRRLPEIYAAIDAAYRSYGPPTQAEPIVD
ncbi:MAG TPA: PCYCGC motif-containing (lipo)protein [Roseiflexaceae bacterium]|nr:PCYCGC motif-containing (lipo)protein [Roseiflexaceae bacterium]